MTKYITALLLLFSVIVAKGQDTHFSQYYANPLYLAPSMAGSAGKSRVALQFRDQWPSMPGKFVAYAFGAYHYFNKFKSGLGMQFVQETAGSTQFSNTQVAFSYAFITKINYKWTFRPGLGVYYFQRSFDINRMIFGDQLYGDDNTQSISIGSFQQVKNVDLQASLMVNNDDMWFGVKVDHLAKPSVSFVQSNYRMNIRYSVFAGYRYAFKDPYKGRFKHSISFVGNYYLQGEADQLDIGVSWLYKRFLAGFWYRGLPSFKQNAISDALIIMAGMQFNNFALGYSYDLTISKLGPSTGGAHELAVTYSFAVKERKKVICIPCSTF